MIRSPLRCLRTAAIPFRRPCRVNGRAFVTRPGRPSETIKVPIGGSGNVEIDIEYPSVRDENGSSSLFIHLPSGPSLTPNTRSILPKLSEALFANRSSTHLTINYRLSAPSFKFPQSELLHRFPQPVHDVSASFDYILNNIVPSLFPSALAELDDGPSFYITGSHIGGALATTLALTEPSDIAAVAVYNPMADWVSLDEHVAPISLTIKNKKPAVDHDSIAQAARDLIDTRTRLFATPSVFFDPFASPTLFLRAPGRDTPRSHAEALGLLDVETGDIIDQRLDETYELDKHDQYLSNLPTPPPSPIHNDPPLFDNAPIILPDPPPSPPNELRPIRRRKVLRRWPPVAHAEDVLLPYMHIFTSSPSPRLANSHSPQPDPQAGMNYLLAKQAYELTNLLRRACFWGRESGFAEERVRLTDMGHHAEGLGQENGDGQGALAAANAMAEWLSARADADTEQRTREKRLMEAVSRNRG